jgi:hypothetical protein
MQGSESLVSSRVISMGQHLPFFRITDAGHSPRLNPPSLKRLTTPCSGQGLLGGKMQLRILRNGHWTKASTIRVGFLAPTILGIALAVSAMPVNSVAQAAPQSTERLTLVGTSTIHSLPSGSGAFQAPEIDTRDGDSGFKGGASIVGASPVGSTLRRHSGLLIPSKEAARSAGSSFSPSLPLSEPVVKSDIVVSSQAGRFLGFNGLSHVDQRTANGGNQFSLEPPDQGLCAGNGFVVEAVNDVIRVFDTRGNALVGVEDLNTFFGLAEQVDRTVLPAVPGPFLSDPKCYYDRQSGHWFVSELLQDNGANPGASNRNFNLLAVSQTTDPTGKFTVFKYDVTDDGLNGTPSHGNCPCFGDQPLLGADKYGIYQSTNEFPDSVPGFNGAQIYAISKAGIIAAAESSSAPLPVVVHIDASLQLVPFGGLSYSIQPATSPDGNAGEGGNGVEFFLSALQFVDTFDNRIAVWALTNTRSLGSSTPVVNLSFDVLKSETYGQPDEGASQLAGEIPLGVLLGDPEELIAANDDRMNQVVFANGVLYGGVNSKLSVGGATQTGIAWFAVKPSFQGPNLKGKVVHQGYVALKENNALFPSLGINKEGNGVIAFSVTGTSYFPSAAYVVVQGGNASRFVHIAGAGQDPDDGFTGYKAEGGDGVGRWGDYSAAVADGSQIWFASEYIPNACSTLTLPCRTTLANWGTFVAKIRP